MGSTMLQMRESVGYWENGSMIAVSGSGTTSMSDVCIDCQPRMDEPSNPRPSSKILGVNSSTGTEKCCQSPGKSMNFMSTITAPCFLAISTTSFGVISFYLR